MSKNSQQDVVRGRIVKLCARMPNGATRVQILGKVPRALHSDIDALVKDERLIKVVGSPTMYLAPGEDQTHEDE